MNQKAFTLIELMIVVAIIVFLASIAIPRYMNYFTKARQAEVAVNLAALHTAQQTYWAEHGEYTTELGGQNGASWQPEGYKGGGKQENFYYTYGFNSPGAKEGVHYFTGKLQTPKETLGQTQISKDGFIAKAAANVSSNKTDIWQVDETRTIKNIQKGV